MEAGRCDSEPFCGQVLRGEREVAGEGGRGRGKGSGVEGWVGARSPTRGCFFTECALATATAVSIIMHYMFLFLQLRS